MPLGYNRVLGNSGKTAEVRPHRVAMANWPATVEDPRVASIDALLGHVAASGYEGIEFRVDFFSRYYPDDSPAVVASKARRAVESKGLIFFGSTLHLEDQAMRQLHYLDDQITAMKLVQDLGGQYASYQISIHPQYAKTGGLYREDDRYLRWCAARITELRGAAWDLGMNFYLEVHVDRITEDPAACCRLLELASCELTGDMSHYLARGFMRGRHVEKVLDHVGHAHLRLARLYGDLSAAAEDPKTDWENKGVTWMLFQFMMPALANGLSSRTLAGETGPMHLVKDTLTQDAVLVPLYRAMARYADASAQDIAMTVNEPQDLRPWG